MQRKLAYPCTEIHINVTKCVCFSLYPFIRSEKLCNNKQPYTILLTLSGLCSHELLFLSCNLDRVYKPQFKPHLCSNRPYGNWLFLRKWALLGLNTTPETYGWRHPQGPYVRPSGLNTTQPLGRCHPRPPSPHFPAGQRSQAVPRAVFL